MQIEYARKNFAQNRQHDLPGENSPSKIRVGSKVKFTAIITFKVQKVLEHIKLKLSHAKQVLRPQLGSIQLFKQFKKNLASFQVFVFSKSLAPTKVLVLLLVLS